MWRAIEDVEFVPGRADIIEARGMTTQGLLEALTASQTEDADEPLRVAEYEGRRGGVECVYLCREPQSGRYLHVIVEVMPDGTAWCFHARDMTPRERDRFRRQR